MRNGRAHYAALLPRYRRAPIVRGGQPVRRRWIIKHNQLSDAGLRAFCASGRKGRTSDVARRRARGPDGVRQETRDDRQHQGLQADDGRGVSGVAARRPRNLHLRRARQGRHHASGLPQYRAHDRAPLRRAARSQAQGQAAGADRHRQRRHDARLLQVPEECRGIRRRPRRHRRMGAALLRLARPRARLQGRVPRHARRQRRILRALAGEREALVPLQPGARAVRQSRHHPSRPSIATARPTRSATSTVMSRRRPMPASSSPAPRWWRPARR